MLRLLSELVRKDLRIFIADRRSVIISFATPVILACFIGFLFSQTGGGEPTKVALVIVDQDRSPFSRALIAKLRSGGAVKVSEMNEAEAAKRVRSGDIGVAVVIPPQFGDLASQALTDHTTPPNYRLLGDPTKALQTGVIQGVLMKTTMQVLPAIVFGSDAPVAGQMPFGVKSEPQTSDKDPNTSSTAHAFAGMGLQGLLFWAIESAMTLLTERNMGIWRRLRASPVAPWMFLLGKALSSTIRALVILCVVFVAGSLIFHFHIRPDAGSYAGFGLVAVAASMMTATFGLFVASLGRNVQQSRGLSTLAVLGLCMLGGAWFPLDFLPHFMTAISKVTPVSWAVNGFDDMIWRGGGMTEALESVAVLVAFSLVFGVIALKRIRWEPEAG